MTWQQEIDDHYRKVWDVPGVVCDFAKGPIDRLPADFRVLRFPPHGDRTIWTYATRCMSQPEDTEPVELHIFAPRETEEIMELLFATAHFHRTGARLDIGHTVNFGKPWIGQSICDHGLVSLPYLDGPDLEILEIGSKIIHCYWLIPIANSEVEFKKRHGLEALEEKFEQVGFDYVDPDRKSVS